jgi:RHS repeat-associated protein
VDKFENKYQVDYTDWIDYGARMYDTSLGRWMCSDPLAEKAANWTPYRYCFNNPIRMIDLDGLYEWDFDMSSNNISYVGGMGGRFWQYVNNIGDGQTMEMDNITFQSYFGLNPFNYSAEQLKGESWDASYYGALYGGNFKTFSNRIATKQYHYNQAEIRPYEPDLMDKWSESSNFLGAVTYSIADDVFLLAQASPFGAISISRSERVHLNGAFATQGEVEDGFVGGLSMFMPSPVKGQSYFKNMTKSKMYPNELFVVLNSSQFGMKFKGTFLTKGKMRFTYNRHYNKGVNWLNNWYNKSSAKTIVTTLFPISNED